MVTTQQPFSTILALKIMQLVHTHDLELTEVLEISGLLSAAELSKRLTAINAKIADAVLEACRTNLASLEAVVDRVLQIEEQMRLLRSA